MKTDLKVAFVIPYFGKLPNSFQLWLDSAGYNTNIDFLLFTNDDTEFSYPNNVKKNVMTFDSLRNRIQKKFDFKIKLETPYKLCDYKPAYGEIFSKELRNYDYWGYCDLDIIWGNIRKFITDDILLNYDRVFSCGHCSIFRNSNKVNSYYKTLKSPKTLNYKYVYSNRENFAFDEWGKYGISNAFIYNDVPMYNEVQFADIDPLWGYFKLNSIDCDKNIYIDYNNGILSICNKNGFIREVAYAHFQKRELRNCDENNQHYVICAPGFVVANNDGGLLIKRQYFQECKYTIKYIIHTGLKKILRTIRKVSNNR